MICTVLRCSHRTLLNRNAEKARTGQVPKTENQHDNEKAIASIMRSSTIVGHLWAQNKDSTASGNCLLIVDLLL